MTIYSKQILDGIEDFINVGISLSSEKDLDMLLEKILTETRRITGADAGTLYILEDDKLVFKIIQNDTLNIHKNSKNGTINMPPVSMSLKNVASYVAITEKAVNIKDVYKSDEFEFSGPYIYDKITGYHTQSMMVVPLQDNEGKTIGILQIINCKDDNGNIVPFPDYYKKNSLFSSISSSNLNYK